MHGIVVLRMCSVRPSYVINTPFTWNLANVAMRSMCSGKTIADRLKARGPISSTEAALWLRQIASALSYMHKQRVIHRDLKPANCLVNQNCMVPHARGVVWMFGVFCKCFG